MADHAGLSTTLFPAATWTSADPVQFPERPYPGYRPSGSWRLAADGLLHGLDPAAGGWVDRLTGDDIELADRQLVLGYGSNLNPIKLTQWFPDEEVFVLRAAIVGAAAAWCGSRRNSGDVVATLVESPGRVEVHALLAVTAGQLHRMDGWEGHPDYYRRQPFIGDVLLEDGTLLKGSANQTGVQVYVGSPGVRSRLLINDQPLLVADVPYERVDSIVPRR